MDADVDAFMEDWDGVGIGPHMHTIWDQLIARHIENGAAADLEERAMERIYQRIRNRTS